MKAIQVEEMKEEMVEEMNEVVMKTEVSETDLEKYMWRWRI
jgi:hypothetical protein